MAGSKRMPAATPRVCSKPMPAMKWADNNRRTANPSANAVSRASTSPAKIAHGASVAAWTDRAASLGWTAALIKSCPDQHCQREKGEARVVAKIAPPQPAGFRAQPEQPFKAAPLDPKRGLRLGS